MAERAQGERYVVVGGGVAGVSCAAELARLSPESQITVVSDSPLIKAVTNVTQQTRVLESFDIEEKQGSYLEQMYGNVTVLSAHMTLLRHKEKMVQCSDGRCIPYNKLCICTGARPKMIVEGHPQVLGIRDTESVEEFQRRLQKARRVVVVGNGGIATELVYEVKHCEMVWIIRHCSICSTFVDEGAAVFFLPHLSPNPSPPPPGGPTAPTVKRTTYVYERLGMGEWERRQVGAVGGCEGGGGEGGSALGPDWQTGRILRGTREEPSHVHVEYECEVAEILAADDIISRGLRPTDPQQGPNIPPESQWGAEWSVYVLLTNGKVFGCDLVVSATGASPNTSCLGIPPELALSEEGGVVIDNKMRTNLCDVYAAGDVCTASWTHSQLWFQMRLWTQGRQMGMYAARTMVAHTRKEAVSLDFCFEIFSHVTKFFGYKVVLLGLYNAQGLDTDQYELLLRCTKGEEYVKAVLRDGRMVGAILIGETDLEETFENLILNQMDLSQLKDHLLDPRVDIEDFFD